MMVHFSEIIFVVIEVVFILFLFLVFFSFFGDFTKPVTTSSMATAFKVTKIVVVLFKSKIEKITLMMIVIV